MTSNSDNDLVAAFLDEGVSEGMLPSGSQRRFVDEFVALYQTKGLMSGTQTPPLYDCCPNAGACWKNREEWKPRGWGGVTLPWIGPDYADQGGVVVLAMNMNQYGGLAASFYLASCEERDFGLGKKRMLYGNDRRVYSGSDVYYRTTRTAASVLDKLDGCEVVNHDDARELVRPLRRIARWNAVKCSPSNKHSPPTSQMWTNCPDMLLADELRIAKPKVILTFGDEVFDAVQRMDGFESAHRDWPLKHGTLIVHERAVNVLGLYHPNARSRGYWQSHDALVRLLRSPGYVHG